MYIITWTADGVEKTLKVHTMRAAHTVVDTLNRSSWVNTNINLRYTAPRRFREVVIVVER